MGILRLQNSLSRDMTKLQGGASIEECLESFTPERSIECFERRDSGLVAFDGFRPVHQDAKHMDEPAWQRVRPQ